jgi:Neprosin
VKALGRALAAGLVAMACLVAVPGLEAAYTAPHLYDCGPRDPRAADPPPLPQLPPEVAAQLPEAIAANDFRRLCPPGEVPKPTRIPNHAKRVAPTAAHGGESAPLGRVWAPARRKAGKRGGQAGASRSALGGFWYSWSIGYQLYYPSQGINGLFALQTNERPYIPESESKLNAHSSAQIWAIKRGGAGCYSTAETGWSESIGQFGDSKPHLFVYSIDCGVGNAYSSNAFGGINWVQSSPVAFPNMALTNNDTFHVYGARMDGNNWWIYYDGQWVGYIPHSSWSYMFPNVITEAQAGGELMTVNHNTCADMGYAGLYGGNPGAAMFANVWYEYNYNTQSTSTYLTSHSSDPSYYATGNWSSPPNHGYAFRYGGPGWC